MIITIDGPVASGKTSVARAVARTLGYTYLATGMLYRGAAYSLLHYYNYSDAQLRAPDERTLDAVVAGLSYIVHEDGPHVYYHHEDITMHLKTPRIDIASSLIALTPYIHQLLCVFQREFSRGKNIVIESRDAGTIVFPSAPCKFFLTATVAQRARRWQRDQERQGVILNIHECEKLITERDQRDITRTVSPLVPAHDAITLDSTHLSFDQVVDAMVDQVQQYLANHQPAC